MICAAWLFGALASVSARAETLGFVQPSGASAPQFMPQAAFSALPVLPEAVAEFGDPDASLSHDAVLAAARTDLDRLTAPHEDASDTATATDEGPIETRITLIFARFDEADGEIYGATASHKPTDLAARRWTPVVSHALVAWAYPAR